MASVVMFSYLDKAEEFVVGLARAFEDDLVTMVGGHHHNLVVGQYNLKKFQFPEPARSFWHTGASV